MLYGEIALLLALTVLNGILAMAEMAVVSAKPARLKVLIDQKRRGARRALLLAQNPGRFLSTVQIGITLVGVIAGAYSGATLGERLTALLVQLGMAPENATLLGVGVVVALVTYLSLILGELVPKQLALKAPETLACALAPMLTTLAGLAAPVVWVLDVSGRVVLGIFGQARIPPQQVTEEEIHAMMAEAEQSGVLESDERQIIGRVMRLGDKPVRMVMTPRSMLDMLDLNDDTPTLMAQIRASAHSRFPVYRENPDCMLGIIWAKDVLVAQAEGKSPDWAALVRTTPNIPDTMDALDVVDVLKTSPVHMGMVFDEFGACVGVVTAADILEAILGTFTHTDGDETEEPPFVKREDGSLLIAGWVSADEVHAALNLPHPEEAEYSTAAGLVIDLFGRIPEVGEHTTYQGWRLEVMDRDGHRVDKILAQHIKGALE